MTIYVVVSVMAGVIDGVQASQDRAEAERWLEELRQEEKRLRKDARERLRPDRLVEVEKDW